MKNVLIALLVLICAVLTIYIISSQQKVYKNLSPQSTTTQLDETKELDVELSTGDLKGYYTAVDRIFFDSPHKCNSFVVTGGDQQLIQKYVEMVENGNSVNQINSDGDLIINLDDSALSADVTSSSPEQQVVINVKEKVALGRGTGPCYSFFEISDQNIQNTSVSSSPTITVVGYRAEGPATVDLMYTNLVPGEEYGVTLCVETGGCIEWVESFTPSTTNGSYQMDVRHGYAESMKGLGSGTMRPMLFKGSFGNDAIYGDYFTVPKTN